MSSSLKLSCMSGKSNRMNAGIPSTPLNALPGFQHEAAGAVFAVTGDLVLLQHAEGFAGKVGAIDAGWVEDVAEVALIEAVELRVVGVKFGAEDSAAVVVPFEGRERTGVLGRRVPLWRIVGVAASGFTVLAPLALDGGTEIGVRFTPDVVEEGLNVPGGAGEFQHTRGDDGKTGFGVGGGRNDGELLDNKEVHVHARKSLPRNVVENKGVNAGQ